MCCFLQRRGNKEIIFPVTPLLSDTGLTFYLPERELLQHLKSLLEGGKIFIPSMSGYRLCGG